MKTAGLWEFPSGVREGPESEDLVNNYQLVTITTFDPRWGTRNSVRMNLHPIIEGPSLEAVMDCSAKTFECRTREQIRLPTVVTVTAPGASAVLRVGARKVVKHYNAAAIEPFKTHRTRV